MRLGPEANYREAFRDSALTVLPDRRWRSGADRSVSDLYADTSAAVARSIHMNSVTSGLPCNGVCVAVNRLVLAGLVLLGVPDLGHAATFIVKPGNSDQHDRAPGDGDCADFRGVCTLRAAIEESNALAGRDQIEIPAGRYILTLGRLVISDDADLAGNDARKTSLDGNASSGVLLIAPVDAHATESVRIT